MDVSITCNVKQTNFPTGIFNCLKKYKAENEFVDVSIKCCDGTSTAHKVVLSSYSPRFYLKLKESENLHVSLNFDQISVKIMDALLKFMYEGEVNLDISVVNDFLKTGQELKIYGFPDDQQNKNESRLSDGTCNSIISDQMENLLKNTRFEDEESVNSSEDEKSNELENRPDMKFVFAS